MTKDNKEKYEFSLEKQLVILSVQTINKLLSFGKSGTDALTLYVFYYHTAKWQETNQPKATPSYCMKGLGWGKARFLSADKILRDLNLVEKIAVKDKKNRIIGWYVRLNYIWGNDKENQIVRQSKETEKQADGQPENPQAENSPKESQQTESPTESPEVLNSRCLESPPGGVQTTNALSDNNINALSVNNKNNINNVVNYFFSLKGWDNKDKDFYAKHKIVYSRYVRPAKQLLQLCDGSLDEAKFCLKKVADWADSRNLDWGIETVFKKWYEIDILAPKEKKPYFRGMRIFKKVEGGKWYVVGRDGNIRELGYAPSKSEIEWK
jgi:hypothetical protein